MSVEIIPFPTTNARSDALDELEMALLDYAVRYGMTDKARWALRNARSELRRPEAANDERAT